jgi:hypothetical protein
MNLNICVSRFIVIGCVIFETRLNFYEMEGLVYKTEAKEASLRGYMGATN